MHLNLSSLVNAPSAIIESFFHVLPRRSVKQDQTGDIFSKWLRKSRNARHLLLDKPDTQSLMSRLLIGSQDKEISVFLGKTSISLVECECWTEMNHVIEFSSEFTGKKINQVLCLT